MKQWMIGFSVLAAALFAQATVVDFTAAEGYSGAGTTGVWAESLHAQGGGKSTWIESSWGSFAVDSSAGVVQTVSTGFKKAFYNQALSSGQSAYTVGVKFTFDRDAAQIADQADLMSVELTESYDPIGNRIALSMQRQKDANSGKYRLTFYENTGLNNSFGNAGWSDETVWGFADAADTTSDDLWLEMTVYRGADASSWTVSGLLSNLTTGASVELATTDIGSFDTSSAYFSNSLYGGFGNGEHESDGNFSNRVIDQFEVTAVPEPVTLGLLTMGSAGLLVGRRFRQ